MRTSLRTLSRAVPRSAAPSLSARAPSVGAASARSSFLSSARASASSSSSRSTAAAVSRMGSVRFATTSDASASSQHIDPVDLEAQEQMDKAFEALQANDFGAAEQAYEKSTGIKETAPAFFNLGVVRFQQRNVDGAITAFERAVDLATGSDGATPADNNVLPLADVHANLGTCYLMTAPPRPDRATHHLRAARTLAPDDAEVAFNLALVLEVLAGKNADDQASLEEAVQLYDQAVKAGIERAEANLRNASAKLLGKRMEQEKDASAGESKPE